MSPRNAFRALAVLTALSAAAPVAFADKAQVYTGRFSNTAVGGYDAVSYHTGTPQKGDKAFATDYQGAEYRFANQANLDAFKENPAAYAPQYGGYCAWAVSQGYTAKGSPKHWRVVDGKLYLNYNGDVQKTWEADIPGFVEAADANWPTVLKDK